VTEPFADPVRSDHVAPRTAPFRPLPDHDASLLRLFFRGVRFPDTEWWSHAAYVVAESSDGERRELSLFANVQLLGEPFRGEIAPAAVFAVRDVQAGDVLRARSRGTMGSSRACRYMAPGWLLFRLDARAPTFEADALGAGLDPDEMRALHPSGAFVIEVDATDFGASLVFGQQKATALGRDGWVDYNPDGETPLWTSAMVRISNVTGSLTLKGASGAWTRYRVSSGHAHSEHQCIVPSTSAAPLLQGLLSASRGPKALLEAAVAHPRWHWFHADLGRDVNLTAHRVWNPRNGRAYRDHATLLGPGGVAVDVRDFTCSAPRDDGKGPVPTRVTLGFDVPAGEHGIARGRYEVDLRHRPDLDWTVPFTMPLDRVCHAREAHCDVEVRHDGVMIAETKGGHETIDLRSSLEVEGREAP
jgi:hypothetical protein